MRTESALDTLERVKKFAKEWIREGHISGKNTHNVSATISIKNDEWESVGEWMWKNKDFYNGLSILPHDGGTYVQAPFEDITKKEYIDKITTLKQIDLQQVTEADDNVQFSQIAACAGGSCTIE